MRPSSPGTAGSPEVRAASASTSGPDEEILRVSGTAAALLAHDGRVLGQSLAHRELLGYDDDALLGAHASVYLGEGSLARLLSALGSSGVFEGDVVAAHKDGSRIQLELEAFQLREDDTATGAVCILHDPRRGQAVERRLKRSVSLLQATLDSTADGLLVVDRAGRIVRYNKRFVRLWNLSEETLATQNDEHALGEAVSKVADPDGFLARVRELYGSPEETSFDVIELRDGRIIERYSRPQWLGEEIVGRVWSFRDVTKGQRAQVALRDSEARYRRLFEESRQAIYLTTRDGRFVDANPAALTLFGFTRAQMLEASAKDVYESRRERTAFQRAVERSGAVVDYPVRLRTRDGRVMDCLLTSTVRVDSEGDVIGYQGIIEDVTERRAAERALRESEQKFRALIEHASDTITLLDAEGQILYESPSVARVLGYTAQQLLGTNVFDYVHPRDRPEALLQFQQLLTKPESTVTLSVDFRHGDGSWRALEVVGQNLLHNPAVGCVVVNARDVTDRKEAEQQLLHDAFHDKLTNLPNRALLIDRVSKLLQRAKRADADPFAVLFLDMDRFKVVNDSLGHMVGDQLLVALARRLQTCLRPGDTVARLGGDEFTMLLDDADAEVASGVAERVQKALEKSFTLGKHEVFTSVSIGIATSDGGYRTPEDMLRDADLAMYRAKDQGRARHELFDQSMRLEAMERLELETALRRALDRAELEVFYQPIVAMADGRLYGFEALVRWRHPERGLLLPSAFLSTAADTGLIVPIEWRVLDLVCRQVGAWARSESLRPVPIQVNVSAQQFARTDFLERVGEALARHDTPAGYLHLELTESTMMENAESTVATLQQLKALGIGLSIDDFGTGYSSLSYLHRFPTDSVKIDRSFVARMGPRGEDTGMVRTIVDLAHDLGMRVVAEGIESETQAALLRSMRCEYAQGFLYARPLPAEEASELLQPNRRW